MPEKTYLIRRKPSMIYYALVAQADGRVVWRSLKTTSKSEALAAMRSLDANAIRPRFLISDLIMLLRERLNGRVRPSTLDITVDSLEHLQKYLGDKPICEITSENLYDFVEALRVDYAPTSLNIYLRHIRASLNRAKKWGKIDRVPHVELMKVKRKQAKFLTREEFDTLLSFVKSQNVRDALTVAVHTGLRRGELIGLLWEQVDFEKKQLTVRDSEDFETKTAGSARTIPLNETALEVLRRRKRQFTTDRAFPITASYLSHRFAEAAEDAGLDLPLHALRHTFASWLLMAGVPAFTVKELLGHSSTALIDEVYGHLTDRHLHEEVAKIA